MRRGLSTRQGVKDIALLADPAVGEVWIGATNTVAVVLRVGRAYAAQPAPNGAGMDAEIAGDVSHARGREVGVRELRRLTRPNQDEEQTR